MVTLREEIKFTSKHNLKKKNNRYMYVITQLLNKTRVKIKHTFVNGIKMPIFLRFFYIAVTKLQAVDVISSSLPT